MLQNNTIYFDNAATSFPKPVAVTKAIINYMTQIGANPGRSGHRLSIEAGEIILSARLALSNFFNVENPMRVLFGYNATDGLNLAIQGILKEGDHVITTSMEHNSTIRPLKELEKAGKITISIIQSSPEGKIDLVDFKKNIKPHTTMAVINHGSNVFGTIQPIEEIGKICRKKGIIFLLDTAQTSGVIPNDITKNNIDILAFTGHKGFFGPTGTGGLILSDHFDPSKIEPLRFGGTGSFSEKIEQPDFLPDKFESGTLNVAGIAGLLAGIDFINEQGINKIYNHKKLLVEKFIKKSLKDVNGFINYIPINLIETGTVSFNIKNISSSELAETLSDDYNIMSRAGLHCAPLAHETIGTFPRGTVRFSFSFFNTLEEIDMTVKTLKKISRENKKA
jgi:cysteine desulfurase / selenocysteine lyase